MNAIGLLLLNNLLPTILNLSLLANHGLPYHH